MDNGDFPREKAEVTSPVPPCHPAYTKLPMLREITLLESLD